MMHEAKDREMSKTLQNSLVVALLEKARIRGVRNVERHCGETMRPIVISRSYGRQVSLLQEVSQIRNFLAALDVDGGL